MTNLTDLELDSNIISDSDISVLSNLTKLTRLWLFDNNISDISVLSNLTNLTELYLQINNISDISVLFNLTNLTELWLWGNNISDLSALSNLSNLTVLHLWGNNISDISVLSNLTNLTELGLGKNIISDISVLSNLTNLTWLNLHINSISDISPLIANTGLGSGDEVDVRDNPLSPVSINTHIPALQGRGVTVQFGSSKPAIGEKETRMPSMPVMKENERRLPRALMEQFGVGAREEAEYMSRKWMEMGEDVISQTARREIRNTTKTDARDRMRIEIRQEMISRKASLRDKARREAR